MITRAVGQLWLVTGRVHQDDDAHLGRWGSRSVYLEHNGFPPEQLCLEALLHNWSALPHVAEVLAVQQFKLDHSIKLTSA